MSTGKMRVLAMGMALTLLLAAGRGAGGEFAMPTAPDAPPAPMPASADSLVSLRKNAAISIGGEFRMDYTIRAMDSGGPDAGPKVREADLAVRNLNLRLRADVHPNLSALFKIDLTHQRERLSAEDEIIEEALLVMHSLAGTGLGFFAGKGRAPYGQDITLGIIQSYHHSANHVDTSEGRIFIVDPPETVVPHPDRPDTDYYLPPMRPGQFDRAFLAGVSYQWDNRWRVEAAAFQPGYHEYRPRLENRAGGDRGAWTAGGSDIGFAGRLWLNPLEGLVVEISGLAAHSTAMGRKDWRLDLRPLPDAEARKNAYAVSVGFDWRRGPWRVFGEYQHGWDWNFSKGYDTDTWQLGLARELAGGWRLGGMAESLRLRDPEGWQTVDKYYKLAFNVKYVFGDGLFVLGEYGHEWFRRERSGVLSDKRDGNFFGVRMGFSF